MFTSDFIVRTNQYHRRRRIENTYVYTHRNKNNTKHINGDLAAIVMRLNDGVNDGIVNETSPNGQYTQLTRCLLLDNK